MARCFVLTPCISHIIFRQIWEFEMRRKISCLKKTGEKLENDECESIEVEHNRWIYHLPSFPPSVPHLQSGSGKAAGGAGEGGGLRRLTISREFQLFPCQNTSRVACVLRKCQGVRAMNRIQVLVSSATFVVSHRACNTRASLVYTTIKVCTCTRLCAHAFRGTEFIFLEKIRKGIPSSFFHPRLPFSRWHSLPAILPLNSHPRVYPRNSARLFRKRYVRKRGWNMSEDRKADFNIV